MPQKLSDRPEELLREFVTENIRSSEIEGYDPQQTDPTASDFLPIFNEWNHRGDHYPCIVITETDGPTVPNSGNTGYNGLQGDGSGPNQYNIKNITVSCQAAELDTESAYLNGVEATELAFTLYQEVHHQIQNNATSAVSEALHTGLTPPTQTKNMEETDSGSTLQWYQQQGTCQVGVLNTP